MLPDCQWNDSEVFSNKFVHRNLATRNHMRVMKIWSMRKYISSHFKDSLQVSNMNYWLFFCQSVYMYIQITLSEKAAVVRQWSYQWSGWLQRPWLMHFSEKNDLQCGWPVDCIWVECSMAECLPTSQWSHRVMWWKIFSRVCPLTLKSIQSHWHCC